MPATDPPVGDEFAGPRAALLQELRTQGITDARVLGAVGHVPRHEFVRPEHRRLAYLNEALPTARGQTISQPYIVAIMTQLLRLTGTERVLEVGTGSGYQAAVLSVLVREVYTIEIDADLATSARQRLQRLGYHNVHVRAGDGFYGWEEAAPFDAVIITATAPRVPAPLLAQLRPDGPLVMPLHEGHRQVLIRATARADGVRIEHFDEVAFVPMTGAVRTPTP